jgi:hypothetical protein
MQIRTLAALILLAPALAAAETPKTPTPDVTQPETTPDVVKPQPPPVETTPLFMKDLKLKLSGVIYAYWGIDVAGANPDTDTHVAGNNRFDLTRAYLNVEPQVMKNVWLRITPDLTRVSGTDGNVDGNLALRLKYAYAQFDEVAPGLAVKAGLQHTAYIDFEDSLWKYRVLGPSAYEYFTKKPSSDLGVGAIGKHGSGVLEYQVVVSNGEGYTKAERSPAYPEGDAKYKEVGARVTVAPFAARTGPGKGLKLTGFGQYGIDRSVTVDGTRHHAESARYLGLASYEHPLFTVAAGYGFTRDAAIETTDDVPTSFANVSGRLFTGFGFVNLPAHLRVLGRYDAFDPDADAGGDGQDRVIGGVAYLFSDLVQVIGDWQHFGFDDRSARALKPTVVGDQLFVHLEAKY